VRAFFIGANQLLNVLKGLYYFYLYNSKNSIKLLKIDRHLADIYVLFAFYTL